MVPDGNARLTSLGACTGRVDAAKVMLGLRRGCRGGFSWFILIEQALLETELLSQRLSPRVRTTAPLRCMMPMPPELALVEMEVLAVSCTMRSP